MKPILTLFVLLIYSNIISLAQDYAPIFTDSITVFQIGGTVLDIGDLVYSVYLKEDSIINGISYKVAYDSDSNDSRIGFFRENETHSKAWFWRDKIEDQERLIMDLDLVVGDSFDLQAIPDLNSYYYCDDQRYAIVVSVDEIEGRKRINFDCSGTFDPLQFIEGVGPNASILLGTPDPWFLDFFDFTICQKYENNILTFTYNNDFENGCFPKPISTDEVATPVYFQVFPNPAQDFLSFKSDDVFVQGQTAAFKIQDATGKIVLQQKITAGKNIDIRSLNGGIYFYQITMEKRQDTGKFIKLVSR